MSIQSYTTWHQQLATASITSIFSISFAFELAENVKVNVAGVDLQSDEYTVAGEGLDPVPQTRTVTLATPANVNDVVTIWLDGPYSRISDFTIAGNFSAVNVNTEFDRIFLKLQQLDTVIETLGVTYPYDTDKSDGSSINKLEKLPANDGSGIPLWTTNGAGDLIAGSLEEDSGCSTLRSELANDQSGTDGSRLVGYYNPTAAQSETVGSTLDDLNAAIVGTHFTTGMCVPIFSSQLTVLGWVNMDGGTIGNALSNATTLKDSTAEDLFNTLWNYSNTASGWLPLYDSTGALVARGATSGDDWTANRAIALPQIQGKSVASQLAATISYTFTADAAANTLAPAFGTGVVANKAYPMGEVVTLTTTGNLPSGLATGTNYYVIPDSNTTIQLASTLANAVAGTAINFTDATPTGIRTITRVIAANDGGSWMGEESHALTIAETPAHTHTYTMPTGPRNVEGHNTPAPQDTTTANTSSVGGSTAHNVMQPTIYCNWLMKL